MSRGYAALLLLADGRLPSGGYAHSGGLEPVVKFDHVQTVDELEQFLIGRAQTSGFMTAAVAAVACAYTKREEFTALEAIEAELEARTPSLQLRQISRTLGRQLLRAMSTIHPHSYFQALGHTAHQPIVMGVAAAALELEPQDAAMAVLHEVVSGPAAAAAKVMRVDPFEVHAALIRITGQLDELAQAATDYVNHPISELPADGSPLLDIASEHHSHWVTRLFAS